MKKLFILLCVMSFNAAAIEVPENLQPIVDILNKKCLNAECIEMNETAIVLASRLTENQLKKEILELTIQRNKAWEDIDGIAAQVKQLNCK